MSEAEQLNHLPQLSALLDNVWFKHFIASWLEARDTARDAVCTFPVKDMSQLITMLQTRGEANTFDIVVKQPYNTYTDLVSQKEENERGST